MLMHNDQFSDYDTQDIYVMIIQNFLEITRTSTSEDKREIADI